MATVSSPLPPPVKNDWLPSGLDPHLSPPSPGGPRKTAPTQQVSAMLPFHSRKELCSNVCVLFTGLIGRWSQSTFAPGDWTPSARNTKPPWRWCSTSARWSARRCSAPTIATIVSIFYAFFSYCSCLISWLSAPCTVLF